MALGIGRSGKGMGNAQKTNTRRHLIASDRAQAVETTGIPLCIFLVVCLNRTAETSIKRPENR